MQIVQSVTPDYRDINGIKTEIFMQGAGDPLLFLHPARGLDGGEAFYSELAKHHLVIAPSHPGFGRSDAPRWMDQVEDLAYFYLDLMDDLNLANPVLVGSSLGGWLAAEIAIKTQKRIRKLVLIDPLGIKVSPRDQRDIVDVFALKRADVMEHLFHDVTKGAINHAELDDDQLAIIARHRESEGLFGWSPYMHNPKLRSRLHRIDAPTLVLWGESDRIIKRDYAKAYAGEIPGAVFDVVPQAGHLPFIEQPETTAGKVLDFLSRE